MSSLHSSQKEILLQVARVELHSVVNPRPASEPAALDPQLLQPGGAFVTLHLHRRLRGCIGQLPGSDPLLFVVSHCARAAATEDPRFPPVRPSEVSEIDIELSILSALETATLDRIEAGRHGIVVTRGSHRGVLLPQVASNFHWNAQRFLEETCVKAGLKPDAWEDAETKIQIFTAEIFSESSAEGSTAPHMAPRAL